MTIERTIRSARAVRGMFERLSDAQRARSEASQVSPSTAERPTGRAAQEPQPGATEAPRAGLYDAPGSAAGTSAGVEHGEIVAGLQAEADIEAAVSVAVRDVILRARQKGSRDASQAARPVLTFAQQLLNEIERGEVYPADAPMPEWSDADQDAEADEG